MENYSSELPIIGQETQPKLPASVLEVLEKGNVQDPRYKIAQALQASGGQPSEDFCHSMEQYRRSTGMFAFDPKDMPCSSCDEYGYSG